MPGGAKEAGESDSAAALREATEEVGLLRSQIIQRSPGVCV
jgi:8-oxo-dGTP pyrophosphatase MutT (NUDIX family)